MWREVIGGREGDHLDQFMCEYMKCVGGGDRLFIINLRMRIEGYLFSDNYMMLNKLIYGFEFDLFLVVRENKVCQAKGVKVLLSECSSGPK